jgi:hypothetical protein
LIGDIAIAILFVDAHPGLASREACFLRPIPLCGKRVTRMKAGSVRKTYGHGRSSIVSRLLVDHCKEIRHVWLSALLLRPTLVQLSVVTAALAKIDIAVTTDPRFIILLAPVSVASSTCA